MENKITNYEISKKLRDLGFKSESHCGWWHEGNYYQKGEVLYKTYKPDGTRFPEFYNIKLFTNELDFIVVETDNTIKAYDCHDLLMWLQKNVWHKSPHLPSYLVIQNTFIAFSDEAYSDAKFWKATEDTASDNPANALALAIIQRLELTTPMNKKEG